MSVKELIMTTSQVPINGHTAAADLQTPLGIPLNPRVHGRGQVPSRPAAAFDLAALSRAVEQRDIDYQPANYAFDADIRIVDPDNPPSALRTVSGKPAIRDWLLDSITHDLDLHVVHLVDGGDRVAFTERSHHQDGTEVLATSTAELKEGLITTQHTILVWEQNW